jgi:hypothetical protein
VNASLDGISGKVKPRAQGSTGPMGLAVGVLARPRVTWAELRASSRRHLWLPMVLMLLLTAVGAYVYVRADHGYVHAQAMAWYVRQPEGATQPPVLRPVTSDVVAVRAGRQGAGLAVRWALWTLLLLGASRIFATGALTLSDALTLAFWSRLPYVVREALQIVVTSATGRPIYNQGLSGLMADATPASLTSFRYVVPTAAERSIAALLRGVDVFGIWQLLLVAWGLSAFTGLPAGRARRLAGAIWLLILAVHLVVV